MMNIKTFVAGASAALSILVSGCAETSPAGSTPAEVVSNVLESQKSIGSYYAESTMGIYENDKLTREAAIKEWQDLENGRRRIEMTSNGHVSAAVNNGKQMLSYDEESNTAYSFDVTDDLEGLSSVSPRDQLMNLLKNMEKTHTYEVVGQEEVLGTDAYHVKVTAKENAKEALFQNMEFWVDAKTWFILKSSSTFGDVRTDTEYTKLDFSPEFKADTFQLKIPDGVKVQSLEDMSSGREVSVAEAGSTLGQPFLLIDDSKFKLTKVEELEIGGEIGRTEVTAYYAEEGVPSLTLSIFKTPEDGELGDFGTKVKVRQTEGLYTESIRNLTWDEGGLRYSLLSDNPDITQEQLQHIAEGMKLSSK